MPLPKTPQPPIQIHAVEPGLDCGRYPVQRTVGDAVHVYPRGLKVSDAEMDAIRPQIEPDQFHGEWNYTLRPRTPGV